jgi:uncharacterized damage-inducible protein DinB
MKTPKDADGFIGPPFVQTMAAYNAEMNRRIYAAAGRLSDKQRRADRGAFWGSIHGSLNHLLWGDQIWMSRFDDLPRPPVGIQDSASMCGDFEAQHAMRAPLDAAILDWAARVDQAWLDDDLVWFSNSAGREFTMRRGFLVTHLFNHQTHHRGQVHAMITAAGERTGDTDLMLVV